MRGLEERFESRVLPLVAKQSPALKVVQEMGRIASPGSFRRKIPA